MIEYGPDTLFLNDQSLTNLAIQRHQLEEMYPLSKQSRSINSTIKNMITQDRAVSGREKAAQSMRGVGCRLRRCESLEG